MSLRLIALSLVLLTAAAAQARPEPKTANDWLQRGTEQFGKGKFADALASFTKCVELDPKNAEAFDRRGSAQFMLGKFKESVADFDRSLKLDPSTAYAHWRRGISLYYAGKYEEGKQQFVAYEKKDTNDVENAVWHFLCAARKDGLVKAQAGILKIGKDGRSPMMEVYDLFKGKLKPEDVLAAAKAGNLSDQQRKPRLFYAHLYLGLYYDVKGETKKAIEHLAQASNVYRINHYMGEVARVHHELLTRKKP